MSRSPSSAARPTHPPAGAGTLAGPGSRSRIVAAAAVEFADRGFAGAGVDRIATRARLNKAMIYYHFPSKVALYRAVLREMFEDAGTRVESLATTGEPPDVRLRAFVGALAAEINRRPHMPRIMLRELAERGRHLDPGTLARLSVVPRTFSRIVAEGTRRGRFRNTNPMLAYSSLIGSLLFYFASAPVRSRLDRQGLGPFGSPDFETFVQYLQRATLRQLTTEPARRARSRRSPTDATRP